MQRGNAVEGTRSKGSNVRVAFTAFGFVLFMIALTYASIPLYRIFCQITGFGGTVQRSQALPSVIGERLIKVDFDATVDKRLPWKFAPRQRRIELRVGESGLAYYEARNLSARVTAGEATFNVTPDKAGRYFNKIECFCFSEQTLQPGERVDMPVRFFVDPAIVKDPNMKDVKTITLSYTFFSRGDGE